jgi:hypothetical protein
MSCSLVMRFSTRSPESAATTTGSNPMMLSLKSRMATLFTLLSVFTMAFLVAGGAAAAKPSVDESQLLGLGFKVLVATTSAQEDWVKRLPAGQIRPMQRNGKKFFIYPDASKKQVYVGGPKEYAAYVELHPDAKLAAREAVKQGSAYRAQQDDAMKKATARDLSDPFLGADWIDLGMGW